MQLRPLYAAKPATAQVPIGARRVPPPPRAAPLQLGNLAGTWNNQQWNQPPPSWNHNTELAIRTTQNKAIYDIVEGLGSQSQNMVSHLSNTFASAQTATQGQVMQTIQSRQTAQSQQNAAHMAEIAEANANQMAIQRTADHYTPLMLTSKRKGK